MYFTHNNAAKKRWQDHWDIIGCTSQIRRCLAAKMIFFIDEFTVGRQLWIIMKNWHPLSKKIQKWENSSHFCSSCKVTSLWDRITSCSYFLALKEWQQRHKLKICISLILYYCYYSSMYPSEQNIVCLFYTSLFKSSSFG